MFLNIISIVEQQQGFDLIFYEKNIAFKTFLLAKHITSCNDVFFKEYSLLSVFCPIKSKSAFALLIFPVFLFLSPNIDIQNLFLQIFPRNSLLQERFLKLQLSELRLSELRLSELRLSELRLSEILLSEFRLFELRLSELGLSEFRLSKLRLQETLRLVH